MLWNKKSSDLMTNYLSILVWRRLSSELMSSVQWIRRTEGQAFAKYPKDCTWPIKARIWIWSYSIPIDIKIHMKIICILVDWCPAFTVTSHCLGIPLRWTCEAPLLKWTLKYYAAHGKPLWCHNGFCEIIKAQSQQNKEHTFSEQCTWTLSKQLQKIVPYHMVFDGKTIGTMCRPCWLY